MIFVTCVQFIPESARFNVSTGNTQAALSTLQHIAHINRSVLPEGQLVEPVLVSLDPVSHRKGRAPFPEHFLLYQNTHETCCLLRLESQCGDI